MMQQLNIFLLLFGAIQGWLLSLWLFRNKPKHPANRFLTLLLVIVSLQLTSKVITKVWLMDNVFLFYVLSYKLPYLIGPVVYLFFKTRKENGFSKRSLFHFLPFIAASVPVLLTLYVDGFRLYLSSYTEALFQLLSLGTYTWLSLKISQKEHRAFVLFLAASEALIIITLAVMVVFYPRFPDVKIFFAALTLLIYWISFKALSKAEPFTGFETSVIAMNAVRNTKYAHSSLKDSEADRIEALLLKKMKDEKLFLDAGLTIDVLASGLATSRHHLSQVLNERIKKGFNEYLTDLRLEEFCKRLCDPANFRFTIAAIAADSGFSSVSSFNDVFKKRYGITPSRFRQQNLNKMSA